MRKAVSFFPLGQHRINSAVKTVFIFLCCVAVVVLACCTQGIIAEASFHENADAIAQAAESVLKLNCYDEDGNGVSSGSGFLAFAEGIIITNYHVIDGDVAFIEAITEDENYFLISNLLCADPLSDIAVLQTKEHIGLPLLQLGDSSIIRKGSRVVAIGSPLGLLNTVSEGIYSGEINDDGAKYILFSAAISHGSSGGALFDDEGRVIGITAASYEEGQNLNLAVPINSVKSLWELYQSVNNGTVPITESPEPIINPSPEPTSLPTPEPKFVVGDTIMYGAYEQDDNLSNGPEPIEWTVIDAQEDAILVISKYALDVQPYNAFPASERGSTWEKSTLRKWLNEEFIMNSFNNNEREKIILKSIAADVNPQYNVDQGNDTEDQIFLLSIKEIEQYLQTDIKRKCLLTDYTKAKQPTDILGTSLYNDEGFGWWWLRTLGQNNTHSVVISPDGEIRYDGFYHNLGQYFGHSDIPVRPAMWIWNS